MSRYKDWPKNLRKGVQTAPEHERVFEAIRPNFHVMGFGPTAFG